MIYTPPDLSINIILSQQIDPAPELNIILCDDANEGNSFSVSIDATVVVLSEVSLSARGSVSGDYKVPLVGSIVLRKTLTSPPSLNGVLLRRAARYVEPNAWQSSKVANADLFLLDRYINTAGLSHHLFGVSAIINSQRFIRAAGWLATLHGNTVGYNLLQYVRQNSKDQSLYGTPYLQGGVRWLSAYGGQSSSVGRATLVNTKAEQGVQALGIYQFYMSAPIVSPHIIYPNSIVSTKFGTTKIIPTPVVTYYGYDMSFHGNTTVWFHTRPINAPSINSYATGHPSVFDPTREIQVRAIVESAIFGDVRARNLYRFVDAPSIYNSAFSDYTTVTNQDRALNPKGFDPLLFGNSSITNKTPSLWFSGIAPPLPSLPGVGYRFRSVFPTGFDRLLLGSPVVIKTPEFKISSINGFSSGIPAVHNYTRYITPGGVSSLLVGNHTLWFKYRVIAARSWQSSQLTEGSSLTHGVREVVAQGFSRISYGYYAWVSQGTRSLAPQSIQKDFSSNHMLGGHRTLHPSSFIATEFGTRIIPESTSLYPQGFIAGKIELAQLEFKTKYIEPAGYHIIGQSFFDRWGKPDTYNQIQHIGLYHQGDSGLAPPRWSDWQSIENRNRVVGVVGFSPIRFGYSQIDNNAAPLLTLGIAPPFSDRDDISMISHAIREIGIDSLETPIISTWGVVYNAARVAYPASNNHSSYGQPAVVNTRREYRNVGMIDSLASGVPMVSFRIRTIDIEPRYSIEPPQINLPTIDLWTKYVDLVGYQTGKYGYPYLDIKFNIIYPKYNHTEKTGYATLRNLTPELFINGHDSSEFGRANVRTQWRNTYAKGYDATLIGLLRISDTKQFVFIRGWLDSAAGQKPEVIKNKTNPYVTQTIWLTNEAGNNNGDGFGFYTEDFGRSKLHQNILMPSSIGQSSRFGLARLWSSTIKIVTGYAYEGVSNNATVFNVNKEVRVTGINATIMVSDNIRISPNYIKTGNSEPTGYGSSRVGYAKLEFFHKKPYVYSIGDTSEIGRPSVDLSLKYLLVPPIRPYSVGFPEIPNFKKGVDVLNGIGAAIGFGSTTVKRPPYTGPQSIIINGFLSSSMTSQYVQNFNRSLSVKGGDSLTMGRLLEGDKPFMWQGLRVGAHVPLIIGGYDLLSTGVTTIQLKTRQLTLNGINSFVSDYDFTNFDKRMRVVGTITSYVNDTSADAKGFDSLMLGDVGISLGQHFIRPDGNSNQFRKGGYHA